MTAAETWLREDAAETFMDADKSMRDIEEGQHWAAPMMIVEVRKIVRQVPTATVTVRLESVDG